MSREPEAHRGATLAGALRWLALAVVLAGSLALLAALERPSFSPAPGTEGPAAADARPAPRNLRHDPTARLGATLQPLAEEAAESLGLAAGTALLVLEVEPGSHAARGGLRADDVVTAIAGAVTLGTAGGPTTSATWEALCAALDERGSGGTLDFFVRRDGRTRIVHVSVPPLEEASRSLADAPERRETACI